MTLKILAVILSLISMAVALSSPSTPSDAYQVGYAEGRFDLYTESKAIKKFNECVAEKKKAPEACWQDQIEWTKVLIGVGMQLQTNKRLITSRSQTVE